MQPGVFFEKYSKVAFAILGNAKKYFSRLSEDLYTFGTIQNHFASVRNRFKHIRITIIINPPQNSFQNSGSYHDLLNRMTYQVQENKVYDQILIILQQVFEKELGKENIVLSRHERTRLFQQISKVILTDMLGKIDNPK
ncbi:MAG: hypothetical protein WCK35_02345 [Chloroflexota bacterium]